MMVRESLQEPPTDAIGTVPPYGSTDGRIR